MREVACLNEPDGVAPVDGDPGRIESHAVPTLVDHPHDHRVRGGRAGHLSGRGRYRAHEEDEDTRRAAEHRVHHGFRPLWSACERAVAGRIWIVPEPFISTNRPFTWTSEPARQPSVTAPESRMIPVFQLTVP